MKTAIRRTVSFLIDTAFGFLNTTVKAGAALAAIGFSYMTEPGRTIPHYTGLVILLGVLAVLDALAWFGVMPDRCSPTRPCGECLQYVEANGFYPYDGTDRAGVYTAEEGAR